MRSWVAKLVITNVGSGVPLRAATRRRSPTFRSRNERPAVTGTAAFTTPPKRVAIPPARITTPTSPAASARSPSAASSARAWEPGAGRALTSAPVVGSMQPRTTFECVSVARAANAASRPSSKSKRAS